MKFLTDRFENVPIVQERPILLADLRMDLRAKAVWYRGRRGWSDSLRMLFSDGSLCTILYRMMRACRRWHLAPAAAVLYKMNAFLTGAVIGRGAEFGPGLVILHSFGLVVNSAARGGANVILEGGVVLGSEKGRSPVIEDNVFIGAGAKVIGGARIGREARIGANAVVVNDIPPRATAVGVPAHVVRTRSEAD